MKRHPGIWFTLWTLETWFFVNLIFAFVNTTEFQENLSQLFIRVWLYVCAWWITVFHVRWIEKVTK